MKLMIIVAAVLTIAAGCSATAHVEKAGNTDMSAYKTYKWVDTRTKEDDASAPATAYADISVQNAVNEELQKWGWTQTDDNPSALLAYDVLVEKSISQRQEPVYTESYYRYYYNYRLKRWVPYYFPSRFAGYDTYSVPVKEATITITIIDAEQDKKIWQGWITEQMGESRLTEDDVRDAVRKIFSKN